MKRKKAHPIIAKLSGIMPKVFSKKVHLKGKGISIKESLTSFRVKKLEDTKEKYGFKHEWTIDDCIMFKKGNDKPSVYYD